jgi:hypothetical protein
VIFIPTATKWRDSHHSAADEAVPFKIKERFVLVLEQTASSARSKDLRTFFLIAHPLRLN